MGKFKFGGQAAGLEGIQFLAGHGFDFADLNLNELEKITRDAAGMVRAASAAGLFFVAHAPDRRVDDDAGLAAITSAVEAVAPFQPRTITIHPILWPGSSTNTPEVLARKIEEIGVLSELAVSQDTRIALENTAEDAADMKEVLDRHPDVMLTLDIGHGQLLTDGNKSLDFIAAYPDRIGHVHIHDNVGGDTYYEDLHLPLGEGSIDFAPIMAALAELSQEITFTFEMPRQKAYESLEWLRRRELA